MKNRIVKILGIVLAVAILVGLLIPAMPVSAGNLAWTAATMPSTKGFQLVQGFDANKYAVAPDGKTIFAYGAAQPSNDEEVDASPVTTLLYKSVDGGVTWTDKNIGENIKGTEAVALDVSILFVPKDYATEKTIYAVIGTEIWRSRNGGSSFSMWADAADTGLVGNIVSIDEAEYFRYSGNVAVLVTAADGIALYNDYDAGWELITNAADGLVGTAFIGAAFSPNYKNDAEVLAVTMDATDTYMETMFGLPANKTWNQRVNKGIFLDNGDTPFITATKATFAFPSDYSYSSNNRVFVGLGGAPLDVFRLNGSTTIRTTDTKATDLDLSDDESVDANIYSMAYKGTYASGTLVVSLADENTMFYTKEANTSTPDFVEVDAPPTGINIALAFGGDTLFAGSANDAGFGGVFASSTDYNLFTGLSLISFTDLAAVTIAKYLPTPNAPNQWVILNDGTGAPFAGYQLFFKSADSGKTWKEIYVYTKDAKQINVNSVTFTADKIYLAETGPTAPFAYTQFTDLSLLTSTNGGYTWEADSPTIDGDMSSYCVAGPDIWVGSTTGGVYKNGSYDQVADLDGKIPWVMIPIPGFFMVYTLSDAGPVNGASDVYVSTDNGATFDLLGEEGQFKGLFSWTFFPPAKTIYAANKTNDGDDTIYKWVVGTSTTWDDITTLTLPAGVGITGLNLAGDGTLYVSTKNGAAEHQIYRCVSFSDKSKDDDFQVIDKTSSDDFFGQINSGPLPVVFDKASGTNTLYPIIALAAADSTLGIGSEIMAFGDTLAAPVVVTAPAANAQVDKNFTAKWNSVDSPKSLKYEWQVATDDKFNDIQRGDGVQTSASSAYIEDLTPGTQYYFRARVSDPLFSAWSATAPFTAKLASTINDDLAGAMGTRIAPAAGATGVPAMPSFQWSAVRGASSYKIQVADNPGFTSPLADATTTDPFYSMTTALQPNKTYYWRIQAIAGSNVSDWVSNVFTTAAPAAPPAPTATAAPPAPQPAPTVIVPTPVVNYTAPPAPPAEAPGTPAYIWVIIAIGAVLVIAVIVLIARTRRSV